MWTTIDRARRRIFGASAAATPETDLAPPPTAATTPPGHAPSKVEDDVIILGSHGVDQLQAALRRALGDAVDRPDTPARIEQALTLFLADRGLPGRPRVLRRPAGLSTPESWEIHLEGVDRATGRAIRTAGRTGAFSS